MKGQGATQARVAFKIRHGYFIPSPPVQICAVLAAVTEVIRSQGGKETETEYFAALVSVCDGGSVFRAAGQSGYQEKTGAPRLWGWGKPPVGESAGSITVLAL